MRQSDGFYQYTPLSEGCIRLLELHQGDEDEELKTTLREVKVDNSPEYESISYAWGDPADRIDVCCDGGTVSVTRNLKDALLRLRLTDQPRMLWADAICINQNDVVEKGKQVRIMSQIYANATQVCVWLGHATTEMQPAFKFMCDTVACFEDLHRSEDAAIPEHVLACWPGLDSFFSAPWFSRLWVVQEVYSHACTVFRGRYEISWKDLVKVARYLFGLTTVQHSRDYALPRGVYAVLQINTAGRNPEEGGTFENFQSFECSDPRDRVYAMLSIPPLCYLEPPVQPDYTKGVTQVYEEAIVHLLLCNQHLGVLSGQGHEHFDEAWPSWVPRWDRRQTGQRLYEFTAGRLSSNTHTFTYKPGILTLGGVRISEICWSSSVASGYPFDETMFDGVEGPPQEWLQAFPPRVSNLANDILLRIAMSLTHSRDLESNCPPTDMAGFRVDFLAYMVSLSACLEVFETSQDILQALLEEA